MIVAIDWSEMPGFSRQHGMLIRFAERDTVPYAVFEDAVPTQAEAQRILDLGYGLHLLRLPEQHHDLAFLDMFADRLEYLSIADGRCQDVSPILKLKALKELDIAVNQREEIALSRLSALTHYSGPLHGFADVVSCRSLRHLALQRVKDGLLGDIVGPVEYLEMVDLQNLRVLPELRIPSALTRLYIVGAGNLDISAMASFTELRTAGFDSCRELNALGALLNLPKLEGLSFSNCRELHPVEALLQLTGVDVSVMRRNPFTQEFREAASRSRSTWNYYGAPRPK